MCERRIAGGHRRALSGGPAATVPRAGTRYLRISRGRLGEAELARSRLLPGCRGASVGIDSESGALVVITWWDTREQAQGAAGGEPPDDVGGAAHERPEIYQVVPVAG